MLSTAARRRRGAFDVSWAQHAGAPLAAPRFRGDAVRARGGMDARRRCSSRRAWVRSLFSARPRARSVSACEVPVLLPLLLGLMMPGLPPADPDALYPRVRASSPLVRSILADTAERSATVRDLLARLADSDVIVYIDFTPSRQFPAARTVFVTRALDVRYLRIGISVSVPFFDIAPMIAHELQHAVEIAGEPAVID